MDERTQERSHDILDTLQLVTNEMAVAVTRCSANFRYLWANQAYADWLQRPLSEIVGCPILNVLGKDAFEALLPHFTRVLSGQRVQYEQETNVQGIGSRCPASSILSGQRQLDFPMLFERYQQQSGLW